MAAELAGGGVLLKGSVRGVSVSPSRAQHKEMEMPRTTRWGLAPPDRGCPRAAVGPPASARCQQLVPTLRGVMVLPEDFEQLLVADLPGVEDDPHHLGMTRQPCGQNQPCSAPGADRPAPQTPPTRDGAEGQWLMHHELRTDKSVTLVRSRSAGGREPHMEGLQHPPTPQGHPPDSLPRCSVGVGCPGPPGIRVNPSWDGVSCRRSHPPQSIS